MKWLMFTGPNCAACNTMKQDLDKYKVNYELVDIMDDPKRTARYKVRNLPTLVQIDEYGAPIRTIIGYPGALQMRKEFG